jgi:hypothetical protein
LALVVFVGGPAEARPRAGQPEGEPPEMAARLPAGSLTGALPGLDLTPSAAVVGPECLALEPPQRAARRRPRMFGWLWRSTRNIDIERGGAPLLFYLRSPLLSGFRERADCPGEATITPRPHAEVCASLSVNPGHDDAWSVSVTLPQLESSTPAKLGEVLRDRLEHGARVTLRALGGRELQLDPARVATVEAKPCISEA